jgi:hypothetical protein
MIVAGCAAWLGLSARLHGGDTADSQVHSEAERESLRQASEFFEGRIRPLLAKNCYRCHSGDSPVKSGLRLDSRQQMLAGGKRGAVIVPGDPDNSLLMKAVRHDPSVELRMPPNGQLSREQLGDLQRWIAAGALWPEHAAAPRMAAPGTFTDEERSYWAFQPVGNPPVPEVKDRAWVRTPIDAFVRAAQEARGLQPSMPPDRRTLLRRVTFDLIGLPPTVEEIAAFESDTASDAWEKVVDRLLASPHYGERWGRHWLDVVGYAETDGHEWDQDKPHAYRYRDYVIDALNRDLPYDQFVIEQLAGDLLPEQRLSDDGTQELSRLGTAVYWFSEVQNTPVDKAAAIATRWEKQIDVLGKGFLGMTVACARCHDHKFDPLRTEDYYSLAGYLASSRQIQKCVDTDARVTEIRRQHAEIERLSSEIAAIEAEVRQQMREAAGAQVAESLLAEAALRETDEKSLEAAIAQQAGERGLDPVLLRAWWDFMRQVEESKHLLFYPWIRLGKVPASRFAARGAVLAEQLVQGEPQPTAEQRLELFEDFEGESYDGWTAIGEAFGAAPSQRNAQGPAGLIGKGYAGSYRGTDKLTGRLISRPFWIKHNYLNFLLAGGNEPGKVSFNLLVNGQVLPEVTTTASGSDVPELKSMDVHTLIGNEARIELVDESQQEMGHVLVDQIFFSDEPPAKLELPLDPQIEAMLREGSLASAEELAQKYEELILAAIRQVRASGEASGENLQASQAGGVRSSENAQATLLSWVLDKASPLMRDRDPVEMLSEADAERLRQLRAERAELESRLPASSLALVTEDDQPRNVRVQIGGSYENLGDEVPRRFVEVLAGSESPVAAGSGRLELARWVASADNPLAPRVMVNRVWQHHFGRGIVPTVDNFGQLGVPPSHPELLDYLARQFMEEGWSLKKLHREMLLSATYQQESRAEPGTNEGDPDLRWLTAMPVRRLEAECIRDAMLAVAGTLDASLYGPSERLHLTPYMDGRDLPKESGPLDGAGRRSIYLEVRRNHLTPLLAAFDFPKPDSTVGERRVSVVAPQALLLLNNEFVAEQARAWAGRELELPGDAEQRVRRMHERAFGRVASEGFVADAAGFVAEQTRRYESVSDRAVTAEVAAWGDLAQVLFGLADFRYVR